MANPQNSKRRLGKSGPEVFPIGLGCMGMSGVYGKTDDRESIATIHAAIERGVDLIDTGDFYGMGHNERLIAKALEGGRRDKVKISVKFGALRDPGQSFIGFDGRPAAVKTFLAYSLDRLGVDYIDIYRPARLDPNVPIEETVGAIVEMIEKGYVRQIGLSEVGAETIRRANAVHPIVDLQIEYSLISRGPEQKIFPVLAELGIGATLYGVFARGLLGGSKIVPSAQDWRAHTPRFNAQNLAKNQEAVEPLEAFAAERGLTAGQLALAWVLAKQPALLPVVGARKVKQIEDAIAVLEHPLSPADVAQLERLITPAAISGERYDPAQMKNLDSER
jgi:aryl-alcohol dehydrogenase-like predicted oxidoreductase